jgi:ABC-2 type transport system permease protein
MSTTELEERVSQLEQEIKNLKKTNEILRPNRIRQIGTVTRYELLKYLRGRRLLAIILLTVVVSALILVVPPAIGSQYYKDPTEFITNTLQFLGVLSILSATFFGADAIVSEFESKTGYFLFPNPIRKTTIFLGKFIASALVSVGAIALYYLIAVASVQAIDGSVPANTGTSFVYSLVYLFAILAIAYLFSAVMRSSVYSLVLTFFTFFLILPIVDVLGSIDKFKPWFSITFANGISQYIFQNPYPTDKVFNVTAPLGPRAAVGGPQAFSLVQYYPNVRLSLAVMAAYFVVAFLLAIVLAGRREM